ncbi:MAG: FAD-dependent oxidoreductase [Calditrichaeota bacterium]|nr:FAD-dependent oxidoreductase [Calditrichota bacterium]
MANRKNIYDAVIVGAGPAGLAAAFYLRKKGLKVHVIEKGRVFYKRNKSNPYDVASGIGGSGLFSDGKFSFFPSASNFWLLESSDKIRLAYENYSDLLRSIDLEIPIFNSRWTENKPDNDRKAGVTREKSFESLHIPLEKRLDLIFELVTSIGKNNISTMSEVVNIEPIDSIINVTYKSSNDENLKLSCYSLIYAGGRLSPVQFRKIVPKARMKFIRFEIGIRFEVNSDDFELYSHQQTDVKIIKNISNEDGIELRTFCCCRDGQVLQSVIFDLESYNGYSETPSTNKSNIGLNLRISLAKKSKYYSSLKKLLGENQRLQPFELNGTDFVENKLNKIYISEPVDNLIRDFIKELFPNSWPKSKIYGPTIEGIGLYPELDKNLKYSDLPMWVAGDAVGNFRGLTPSFLSGFYTAQCVLEHIEKQSNRIIEYLRIKQSKTDPLNIIFTAQSKKFFYCRDVVCEYVFNRSLLPVNPFRIFDYFLSDRVPRDIIRRCNNQLIQISDELWVFGPISDGVLFEIALAKKLGLPIRFFSIGTTINDINSLDIEDITFEPEVHARNIKKEKLLNFISDNIVVEEPQQLSFPFK